MKDIFSKLHKHKSFDKPLSLINDLKINSGNEPPKDGNTEKIQILMGSFELGFLTAMGSYKGSFTIVVSEDKSIKPYEYDGNFQKFLKSMDQRWEAEVAILLSRAGKEVDSLIEKFIQEQKAKGES